MSLSKAQQGVYRPLVSAAWREHCAKAPHDTGNKPAMNKWYRQQLHAAAGIYTTKQIPARSSRRKAGEDRNCDMFHDIMFHFAILANDDYWISRLSDEDERRLKHLITTRLAEVSQLQSCAATWDNYVRSMWRHMDLPLSPDDAPAETLKKVFQALDIHVQRLRGDRKKQRSLKSKEESFL